MDKQKIDRVIEVVRGHPANFTMSGWVNTSYERLIEHRCGTAACLGGWMEALAFADSSRGLTPFQWLGVEEDSELGEELSAMFHMDYEYSMLRFDRLPDETRANVAVTVLESFRDTGKGDWKGALIKHGVEDQLRIQ